MEDTEKKTREILNLFFHILSFTPCLVSYMQGQKEESAFNQASTWISLKSPSQTKNINRTLPNTILSTSLFFQVSYALISFLPSFPITTTATCDSDIIMRDFGCKRGAMRIMNRDRICVSAYKRCRP
jgi:hypothetical protein